MAAYYPEKPSPAEKAAAAGLVQALQHLYPCVHCRAQLQIDLQELPPKLDSREDFSVWMCELHNMVNESLGKSTFPCSLEKLDLRWRTGTPSCWGLEEQTAEESLGQSRGEEEEEGGKQEQKASQ